MTSPLCDDFLENLKKFENEEPSVCDFPISEEMQGVFQKIDWQEWPLTEENLRLFKKIVFEGYPDEWPAEKQETSWQENEEKAISEGRLQVFVTKTNKLFSDGRTNVLMRRKLYDDCLAGNQRTSDGRYYVLNGEGTELDPNSWPFSGDSEAQGDAFFYKGDQLVIYGSWLFAGSIRQTLWSVRSSPSASYSGSFVRSSLTTSLSCAVKFTKIK